MTVVPQFIEQKRKKQEFVDGCVMVSTNIRVMVLRRFEFVIGRKMGGTE